MTFYMYSYLHTVSVPFSYFLHRVLRKKYIIEVHILKIINTQECTVAVASRCRSSTRSRTHRTVSQPKHYVLKISITKRKKIAKRRNWKTKNDDFYILDDRPPLLDVIYDMVDGILVNGHYVIDFPRPLFHTVQYVGAMNVKPWVLNLVILVINNVNKEYVVSDDLM